MTQKYDHGFVQQYLDEIQRLWVKSESEELGPEFDELMDRIKSHCRLAAQSSGVDNLPGILGQLKLRLAEAASSEIAFCHKFEDESVLRRADFLTRAWNALQTPT